MKTLILKDNSKDIISKLKEAGINCCTCCTFNAPWLEFNFGVTNLVHGVGYPDEDEGTTSEQELERFVAECKNPYYCKDVEEFITKIKEQQKPLTKKEFNAIINKAIKQMPENWRKGQKVFNAIEREFSVARIVQFQRGLDCFYDDSKIEEFRNEAYNVIASEQKKAIVKSK